MMTTLRGTLIRSPRLYDAGYVPGDPGWELHAEDGPELCDVADLVGRARVVEVRHDGELVAPAQRAEQRPVVGGELHRLGQRHAMRVEKLLHEAAGTARGIEREPPQHVAHPLRRRDLAVIDGPQPLGFLPARTERVVAPLERDRRRVAGENRMEAARARP